MDFSIYMQNLNVGLSTINPKFGPTENGENKIDGEVRIKQSIYADKGAKNYVKDHRF